MLKRKAKKRLHIRSIEAGMEKTDQEIAELFHEMREATGLPLEQIAAKLKTPVTTLVSLEQGNIVALPPWNETSQVIFGYTKMLGLDPEPILRRIMVQLPGDHPTRPRTQSHAPSYDNMRSNADAVMDRVPGSQQPIENRALPAHSQGGGHLQNIGFAPGYGDLRAYPPEYGAGGGSQGRSQPAVGRRKSGFFVAFIQLLLLVSIIGAGYAMWLAVNDPQGYIELKQFVLSNLEMLVERIKAYREQL